MDSKEHSEDFFDRVYHNQASEEELKQFKLRLKNDSSYRKTYQEYLTFNDAVLKKSRDDFQDRFKIDFETTTTPSAPAPKASIRPLRLLAIAASFLLFITASLAIYNYANYWQRMDQKYALIIDEARLLGPIKNNNVAAEQASKNEAKMEEGFQLLKKASYLPAINAFEAVMPISTQEFDDYFTAQYNIALAHLKLKEIPKAKQVLTQLSQRPEQHYLKVKSKELLVDLEKSKFFFF